MAALLKTVYKLSGHSSGPVLWVHKVCMKEMSYITTMSAALEFPLSKYLSCSNTNNFCLQTSFTRELGCITQSIFHVLYKLNFLKWNPLSNEENALAEPASKATSCSSRRGFLHNGFVFPKHLTNSSSLTCCKSWRKAILHMPCLI